MHVYWRLYQGVIIYFQGFGNVFSGSRIGSGTVVFLRMGMDGWPNG